MKRITEIELEHIKGVAARYPLEHLNAVVGPTGSGKTAVLDAIRFGLTGFTTAHQGKRIQDAAGIVGPRGGAVGITFEDGDHFRRGIKVDHGEDTLSWEISRAGKIQQNVKNAARDIERDFGDFKPMLDAESVFEMKPEAARDFILDLCATRGGGGVDPSATVRQIVFEFLRQYEKGGETVIQVFFNARHTNERDCTDDQLAELCSEVLTPGEARALKTMIPKLTGAIAGEVSDAINAVLDKAANLASIAKEERKNGEQAARELSAQKAELGAPAGDLELLKKKHAELQKQNEQLVAQVAEQEERERHASTIAGEIDRLKSRLGEAEVELDTLTDGRHTEEEAAGMERRAELEEQEAAKANNIEELKPKLDELCSEREALVSRTFAVQTAESNRDRFQQKLETLNEQIMKLRDEIGDDLQCSDELRHKAKDIREKGKAEIEAALQQVRDLEESAGGTKAQLEAAEAERTNRSDEYDARHEAASVAQAKLRQARGSPWIKIKELLDDIEECLQSIPPEQCLTAERAQFDINAANELIKQQIGSIDQLKVDLDAAVKDRKQAGERWNDACNACLTADQAHQACDAQLLKARETYLEAQEDRSKQLAEASRLQDLAGKVEKLNTLNEDAGRCCAELRTDQSIINNDTSEALSHRKAAIESEIQDARSKIDAQEKSMADAKSKAEELQRKAGEVRANIEQSAQRQTELKARIDKLAAYVAAAEEKKSEIQSNLTDLQALRERKASLEGQLREASEAIERKQKLQTLEENYNQAITRANERGIEHEVGNLLAKAIKALRDRMMDGLVEPLTKLMDEFLGAYEPGLRSFIEFNKANGKGAIFRIGWIREGQRHLYKFIAGGEQVVLRTALTYGITKLKNPPLKILLVDACTISSEYIVKLFGAIDQVAGEFGNVVLAAHPTFDVEAHLRQWKVNHTGAGIGEPIAV
ncbi:MAG: hypothetical protein MI923_16085 [Phycisphaerales bacterium]|nr:hypothetical protein [Phycisphaerales bacterium]